MARCAGLCAGTYERCHCNVLSWGEEKEKIGMKGIWVGGKTIVEAAV